MGAGGREGDAARAAQASVHAASARASTADYPPIRGDEPAGAGRMLGHEDMDLFTLLPKPSHEGLQVTIAHHSIA